MSARLIRGCDCLCPVSTVVINKQPGTFSAWELQHGNPTLEMSLHPL